MVKHVSGEHDDRSLRSKRIMRVGVGSEFRQKIPNPLTSPRGPSNNFQLQILILTSLNLQHILFLLILPLRKTIPPRYTQKFIKTPQNIH